MSKCVLGTLEGKGSFRRYGLYSQTGCDMDQGTRLKQINYSEISVCTESLQSDYLCHCSLQKEKDGRVYTYFYFRSGLPSFDLHKHFWVLPNPICESLHQDLLISMSLFSHSAPFSSATQLWGLHAAETFGSASPIATCRLQRTEGSHTPGFPRWEAECSSQSLIQPAGLSLPPSGPAVSGWMPTALAHPPEVNKWDQCSRAPWGELRRPVTGTHHCLWLIHQGKVREIYEWIPYASPTSASS